MSDQDDTRGVRAILELQDVLSRIESHAQKLRSKYPNHTFIPNTMIGVAEHPVYGYETECGKILRELRRQKRGRKTGWPNLETESRRAYASFCKDSGNELLWFGWTYWHPTERGDARHSLGSLTASRTLGRWLEEEKPCVDFGSRSKPIGSILTGFPGVGEIEERIKTCGKWVWKEFFNSVEALRQLPRGGSLNTINDYLYTIFQDRSRNVPGTACGNLAWRSFAFVPWEYRLKSKAPTPITQLTYEESELRSLWDWVLAPFEGKTDFPSLRELTSKGVERLRRRVDAQPQDALADMLTRTTETLCLSQETRPQVASYVILQHLAFYRTYLRTPCQYSLLVPAGRHLCVMMIGTKKGLTIPQIMAWRGVAMQIFSVSTIQHFASVEAERRESERLGPIVHLLSHGLTKAFTTPLLNLCDQLETEGQKLETAAKELGAPAFSASSARKVQRGSRFVRDFARLWGGLLAEFTPAAEDQTDKPSRGITIRVGKETLGLSRRFSLTERVVLSDLARRLEDSAYDALEFLALNDLYDDDRFGVLRQRIEGGELSVKDLMDVSVKLPTEAVWAHEAVLLNHLQNLVENSILALDFLPVLKSLENSTTPPPRLHPWITVTCDYPIFVGELNPEKCFRRVSVRDSGRGIDETLRGKFRTEVIVPCNKGTFLLTTQSVREKLRKKEYSTRSGAGLGQAWAACAYYVSRLCLVRPGSSSSPEVLIKRGSMELPEKRPGTGAQVDLLLPALPSDASAGLQMVAVYEEPGLWQR